MFLKLLLTSALILLASCSDNDMPPSQTAASTQEPAYAIQTDTTVYWLASDNGGWRADLQFQFRNVTADTAYAINCNRALTLALEKYDSTGWNLFWAPLTNLCLSPPVIVAPGAAFDTTYAVWGAAPGGNAGPAFRDTSFLGTYRLVWRNLVHRYDPNRGGFGDTLATEHRVSNEFVLSNTPPTVTGEVTELRGDALLIEGQGSGCPRYWFGIRQSTRMLSVSPNGVTSPITLAEMSVGMKATAWAAGVMLESCPAQGPARVIIFGP